MLAAPVPWPSRARPRPAAAVGAPGCGIVIVELSRPAPEAFRVRVRPESIGGAEEVGELHVFYAARVEEVADGLQDAWTRRGMRPTFHARGPEHRLFDFAAGYGIVAWAVELLARRYAP